MKSLHEGDFTGEELGKFLFLVRKVMREGKERGLELSKKQAKKLVLDHLGIVGREMRDEVNEELRMNKVVGDGLKTVNPKYHNDERA